MPRGDSGNRGATEPAGESPGSGQVEQSVPVTTDFKATESRLPTGLTHFLSRVASDPFEVSHAVEDLRTLIEETVRREVGGLRNEVEVRFEALDKQVEVRFEALDKRVEVRFEALESKFQTLNRVMGVVISLLVALLASVIALIVLVVTMVLSEDRSGATLPPPPTPTVQAPAETEVAPPPGAVLGTEVPALGAPGEPSHPADPPADQPTP